MEIFQKYYDSDSLINEILQYNVEYGDNYPASISQAFQTILSYLENEKNRLESMTQDKFRK
jgi:hypothetical protein